MSARTLWRVLFAFVPLVGVGAQVLDCRVHVNATSAQIDAHFEIADHQAILAYLHDGVPIWLEYEVRLTTRADGLGRLVGVRDRDRVRFAYELSFDPFDRTYQVVGAEGTRTFDTWEDASRFAFSLDEEVELTADRNRLVALRCRASLEPVTSRGIFALFTLFSSRAIKSEWVEFEP